MDKNIFKKIVEVCFIICFVCFVAVLIVFILNIIKGTISSNTILPLCSTLLCLVAIEIVHTNIGHYECPICKSKIKLRFPDFMFGYRTFNKAKLKCPNCNKKVMCNKIIK